MACRKHNTKGERVFLDGFILNEDRKPMEANMVFRPVTEEGIWVKVGKIDVKDSSLRQFLFGFNTYLLDSIKVVRPDLLHIELPGREKPLIELNVDMDDNVLGQFVKQLESLKNQVPPAPPEDTPLVRRVYNF
eukprot:GHVR01006180.1.p1 GENE.GHVR01006180.1~~GHVR01006180.1.p1  ORF type:complete len:133 (+),score=26.76 GHVR01006180.1:67-465(+)